MEFQRRTKKLSGLPIAFYVVALLFFVLLFSFNSLYYKASEQTKPVIVETPKPIEEPKADSIVKPEIYVPDVEVLPPDTVALAKETPAVKEEKKYRPLKSIDEMDCLFDCSVMSAKNFLTYRNKTSGKIYIELLFSVCRDKDDILRSINNIPVKNLFNYFEIRKNGEWLPFGVEVKDDE